MNRGVEKRCFQRRESLHHNADMCYCFTTSGSPGRDVTQRSQTVKTKMEECDSSQFYCSVVDAKAMHEGDFIVSSKRNKDWEKKKSACKVFELTLSREVKAAHWWKVQFRTRGVMSCLRWTVAVLDVSSLAGVLRGCP